MAEKQTSSSAVYIPQKTDLGLNTLALDLGTQTGYAVGQINGRTFSGVWNLKGGRYEGGGMRFLRFRRYLDEVHASRSIDVVYYEEVRRHLGTDASHIYGGLLGVLTSWCEELGIPYEGIPVGSIKKATTGSGNAKKEAMADAVRARGYSPEDDNEADAIALLLMMVDAERLRSVPGKEAA